MSDILPSTLGEPLGIVSERRRAARDMLRHCRRSGMSATQLERYERLWGLRHTAEQQSATLARCVAEPLPARVETSERGGLKTRTECSKHDRITIKAVLEAVRDATKVAPWQVLEKHRASAHVIRARAMAFGILHERLCNGPSPLSPSVMSGLLNGRTADAFRKIVREHRANLASSDYAIEAAQVNGEVERRMGE